MKPFLFAFKKMPQTKIFRVATILISQAGYWSGYHIKLCFNINFVTFFFWASCSNHCLAVLNLWADVEQLFDRLMVQNRQAMQSIGRSMDWTLEDNMVDGLFFCATLTGRRRGHTPFVQAGVQTSDTDREAV